MSNLTEREKAFIEAVLSVCQEFGYSISHEDGQGGFLIVNYDEMYSEWMRDASWDPIEKRLDRSST